jgi:hypothetical protein
MCSFSFPVVFGLFFSVTGIRKDKDPTGQKFLVSFGTFRRDTEFWFQVSILFLTVFQERTLLVPPRMMGELLSWPRASSDPDGLALCCLR